MTKTAVIAGITGQDGAYLSRHLLDLGYDVHGIRQPVAVPDLDRLEGLLGSDFESLRLHTGDLTDALSIARILAEVRPDEIYNLAAQSYVHVSFAAPAQTLDVNGRGVLVLLEAVRMLGLCGKTRIFQASTSELFGDTPPPQSEVSLMNPRSPYAASKLFAFHSTRIYREAYGMHVSNGIMFNHESPLRGEEFVTRKIAMACARIAFGMQDFLALGNLNSRRDWSHAQDMMRGAWSILQQDEPGDYVLASGRSHSVRDFASLAFQVAGMPLLWSGEGESETATDARTGRIVIKVDPSLYRPLEVENLEGSPLKARFRLGWKPSVSFSELVKEMVEAEMRVCLTQTNSRVQPDSLYG